MKMLLALWFTAGDKGHPHEFKGMQVFQAVLPPQGCRRTMCHPTPYLFTSTMPRRLRHDQHAVQSHIVWSTGHAPGM